MVQAQSVTDQLNTYKKELSDELGSILDYWIKFTPDQINGGFIGRIDEQEHLINNAPKGSVLNARILWSFSAAYRLVNNNEYLQYAHRAYAYIIRHFIDEEYGGVYWTIDNKGAPQDTKKQVYAIAFTIYALSEYHLAAGHEPARELAVSLYHLLVKHSYDAANTGYLEAFTRDWQPITDLRLSAKDANEKKTMNTHLHVLEAYTNLFRIWPDEQLKQQLITLINNFLEYFVDPSTHHLLLFFDEHWKSKSDVVSFGHDIEATWLLQEAAAVIDDRHLPGKINLVNLAIAEATIKGMDADGGLWYEYEPADHYLVKQKHWWPQAEAMIGFFNAWQISGDNKYLGLSIKTWGFVKAKILDKKYGEWIWGVDASGKPMQGEDKVGLWKCPYHNSRACIEIVTRINDIQHKNI